MHIAKRVFRKPSIRSAGDLIFVVLCALLFFLPRSCDLKAGGSFLPRSGSSAFGSSSGEMPDHAGNGAPTAASQGAALRVPDEGAAASSTEAPPLEIVPYRSAAPAAQASASTTATFDSDTHLFPTRHHPARIPIPASGSGWSAGVGFPPEVPSGYQLCRTADHGNKTFRVQYRDERGWHAYVPGARGFEERYQSTGDAQNAVYFYAPVSESCTRLG